MRNIRPNDKHCRINKTLSYSMTIAECQGFPRPGRNDFRKCSYCKKVFCGKWGKCRECSSVFCRNSNGDHSNHSALPMSLLQFLPFLCQNTKYGCQEILEKKELFDHEKYCDYQKVHCAKIDCKTDISLLNLLGKLFQLNSIFSPCSK